MTSTKILTYAGVLPYIIALIVCLTPYKFVTWPFLAVLISSYSALIISFIAGSHWGIVLDKDAVKTRLISNLMTLIAWVGLLFPSWVISWSILMVCFLSLLLVEYRMHRNHQINLSYFKMRLHVTMIVVLSFIAMAWLGRMFI